jgi:hypothetical protein
VIGIFPREQPPPHFHAVYGEYHFSMLGKPALTLNMYGGVTLFLTKIHLKSHIGGQPNTG